MKTPSGAISRVVVIAVIVVLVIIVAAAGVLLLSGSTTTTTSATSSTNTVGTTSQSSSSSSSSASSSSSVSTSSSVANGSSQVLTVDEPQNPVSTDPRTASDNAGLELSQNVNLPLIFFNYTDNFHFIPVLANSWNESADGKTYTFFLRNDVHYSNGDPFNAYVVWYNIYSSMLMAQGGSFIYYIYFNASGVTVGDVNSLNNPQNTPINSTLLSIMHNASNSVTVINATEVQFHLQQSFAPFLKFVGTSPWNFIDPYVVQQHGGVVANTANPYMNANGSTVGDGPYVVQTWVQNQYSIMVANPNYWAKNLTTFGPSARFLQVPPVKKIIINYKTDELTRSLDLENGKVQGATISFNDINGVLKASTQVQIPNTGLSGTLEYITIDSEKAPTNNTLVRRAIIAAVNTSQIQQSVYENYTVPFVGPVPKGVPYYNSSIPSPAYNLTLAKSLMTQAGYPNGQGFPAVSFVYPQSEYLTLVAQILVNDLAQIGITVKPQQVTISVFNSLEFSTPGNSTAAPDLAWGSFAFIPDFSGYEYIVDSNLQLEFYLNNHTVNSLVDKSNAELNPQARAQDLTQITYAVQQNAVFIWLGQGVDDYDTGAGVGPTIWSKCVTGFWYNFGFNGVPFNALSLTC